MPKITVILPVYNSQKFIEQCLNSIVNQSLKDIEIICINDFSQDNSWDIVKNFAQNDSRFVLIENSENKNRDIAEIWVLLKQNHLIFILLILMIGLMI